MNKRMKRTKHGYSNHPLYNVLVLAKYRCTNKKNPGYKQNKGKWKFTSYREAFEYCLPFWKPGLEISLINEKKGYEIGNIQFVPRKPQPMLGKLGKDHNRSRAVERSKYGIFWVKFGGTREAERQTGVNQGNISQCCQGKIKTAGGYKWRFVR